jgi:hypothetical protein
MRGTSSNDDTRNLLAFVGITLAVTVGSAFWFNESVWQRDTASQGPTFKAAQPIAEGTPQPCSTCRSTGRVRCSTCGGHGQVNVITFGPGGGLQVCPSCGGGGQTSCGWCRGTGTMTSAQPGVIRVKKP